MDPIQVLLETVKQGGKQSHLNLTLIPLLVLYAEELTILPWRKPCSKGQAEQTLVELSACFSILILVLLVPNLLFSRL